MLTVSNCMRPFRNRVWSECKGVKGPIGLTIARVEHVRPNRSSLMSFGAPAAGLLLKKSKSRSSKNKDVESVHRCWLLTFLKADWNHKAAETAWQVETRWSTVRSFFELVLAEELFNSLYKRLSLYWLKHFGKAPVGTVCPCDVQTMGRITSRCRLCRKIISTCFATRWRRSIDVLFVHNMVRCVKRSIPLVKVKSTSICSSGKLLLRLGNYYT